MILNPGEIHIWSTTIDERYGMLLAQSFLSVNEKKNAARFAYDIDTYLFSIRHNLLRLILGNYLNCDPAKIKFNSNHYQKPHIAHPNTFIQFNISVSSNRFVAAFCQQHTIGVDIELIRQIDEMPQLINDYFTKEEREWVTSHPEKMRTSAFFQIWSRKEALVKAIGKGLNIELNKIDILAEETIVNGDSFWHLNTLNLFDDCIGAVAINNSNIKLSFYNTSDLL
jgi:4'-phosphopantetheinyl transferase